MKRTLFFLCFIPTICLSSPDDIAGTFENETYKIDISQGHCGDEDIVCGGITYHSLNKKNGEVLTIKNGHTFNVGTAQDFRGYTFDNNGYSYTLLQSQYSDDPDAWQLLVTKKDKGGDKVLLQQKIY